MHATNQFCFTYTLFRWIMLNRKKETARRIPKPAKHDMVAYSCDGIRTSTLVTKVESRGATPSEGKQSFSGRSYALVVYS